LKSAQRILWLDVRHSFYNWVYGTVAFRKIRFEMIKPFNLLLHFVFKPKIPRTRSGGIQTHVIEMTGTWNERYRPLGHITTPVFSLNLGRNSTLNNELFY
jgi:hypothetical protein